jgi:hypothetical protein
MSRQFPRMAEAILEQRRRQKEALRVFRPLATQDPFILSRAPENIIRGGKRSGKSVTAATVFASAVTGIPIIGRDEQPMPRHFNEPSSRFLAWVIGWDQRHLGQTIHRLLFEPGLFYVIWDEKLQRYRTWNPADPVDQSLKDKREMAEPLIPERLIDMDSWSWENKAEKVFSRVNLKNGVTIAAFPSTARQAKQGDAVDVIWIDEDICYPQHIKEYQDRLGDKGGRIIWSVWPHSTNEALVNICRRAQEQEGQENPYATEVVIRMSDNPFITTDEKRKSIHRMETDEERRARDYGEFMFDLVRMYPTFSEHRHGIFDLNNPDEKNRSGYSEDPISQYWTANKKFPVEWTRYLSMDPSHTRTACMVAVVPPEDFFGLPVVIIEKEIVLLRHGADALAKYLASQVGGLLFESFIIDKHISRMTGVGFGETVLYQYEKAFLRYGLKSRVTGNGFMPGCDQTDVRRSKLRDLLDPADDGPPLLRLVWSECPETLREFANFKKKVVDRDEGRTIIDDAANPKKFDCMAALEYLVAYEPLEYVPIENYERPVSPILKRAREIMARQSQREEYASW